MDTKGLQHIARDTLEQLDDLGLTDIVRYSGARAAAELMTNEYCLFGRRLYTMLQDGNERAQSLRARLRAALGRKQVPRPLPEPPKPKKRDGFSTVFRSNRDLGCRWVMPKTKASKRADEEREEYLAAGMEPGELGADF
jgi:hypothetical protein